MTQEPSRYMSPYGSEQRLYSLAPDIKPQTRLRHSEYGDGTVVAFLGIGVQIMWDEPQFEGAVGPQLMVHDPDFVARLERI